MNDHFTRPDMRYLRSAELRARFQLSATQFYKLRNLTDPIRRFPKPTLILGDTMLWSEDVVKAWEAGQKKLTASVQASEGEVGIGD